MPRDMLLFVEGDWGDLARLFYFEEGLAAGGYVSLLRSPHPRDCPPNDYGSVIGRIESAADVSSGAIARHRLRIRPTAGNWIIEQAQRRCRGTKVMAYPIHTDASGVQLFMQVGSQRFPICDVAGIEVEQHIADLPVEDHSMPRSYAIRESKPTVTIHIDLERCESVRAVEENLQTLARTRNLFEEAFNTAIKQSDPTGYNLAERFLPERANRRADTGRAQFVARKASQYVKDVAAECEQEQRANVVTLIQTRPRYVPAPDAQPLSIELAAAYAEAQSEVVYLRQTLARINDEMERVITNALCEAPLAGAEATHSSRAAATTHAEVLRGTSLQTGNVANPNPYRTWTEAYEPGAEVRWWDEAPGEGGWDWAAHHANAIALGLHQAYQAGARPPVMLKSDARERATRLLERHLTAKQREQFRSFGHFDVRGSHSKRLYRIRRRTHSTFNVFVFDGGIIRGKFCAAPEYRLHDGRRVRGAELPEEDVLLAQALAISGDEQKFLQTANSYPMNHRWEDVCRNRYY